MDIENTFTKPLLLFYYKKGKSETETHQEIAENYGSYGVCLKTIHRWFTVFRKGAHIPADDKKPSYPRKRFTDQLLIDLVNQNPNYRLTELAGLLETSVSNISYRLRQINIDGAKVDYSKKNFNKERAKLLDEKLIALINKNPGINQAELGELSGVSPKTISHRLKKINESRDIDCKITLQRNKSEKSKYIENEFLIKLISDNPGANATELAMLADTSRSSILRNLKRINADREQESKITIQKCKFKPVKRNMRVTDELVIKLVNENPTFNLNELAKLAGSSPMTISRRIQSINRLGERLNYISKKPQKEKSKVPKKNLTNEYIIDLVNNNPNLSLKELAKLANTSIQNISIRIKKINWVEINQNAS